MRKQTIIMLNVLLIAATACRQQTPSQERGTSLITVRTEMAVMEEYRFPVKATGLLATGREMKLGFKTGGIIAYLPDREGVNVQQGDVLARLDLEEIRAQVEQAEIALAKAERDLERAGNLYRDSVATLEQYQDAQSGYELARSRKQIAAFNLQHSVIRAPADGRVQKVLAGNNELTAPGHPVILFASTEDAWVVRASVTDKDIVKLSIGDTAEVRMDAFPERSFFGEVYELASFSDPVTGTYEVEVILHDGHPQFRTGYMARLEIFPAGKRKDIVVPVEALQDASDRTAIAYVVVDHIAQKRTLRIGKILGDRVVVKEGLLPGEEVVTSGAAYLHDGDRVERSINGTSVNKSQESENEKRSSAPWQGSAGEERP